MKRVSYSKKICRYIKKLKRRIKSLHLGPMHIEVDLGGRS